MFLLSLVVAVLPITLVRCVRTVVVLPAEAAASTAYIPTLEDVRLKFTVNITSPAPLSQSESVTLRWKKDGEIEVCTLRIPRGKLSCVRPRSKHVLVMSADDKNNLRDGSPFNVTFIIKRFTDTDVGSYSCSVEDKVLGLVRLELLKHPDVENPLCTIMDSVSTIFKAGTDVLFFCRLPGGSPTPALSWYRKLSDGATSPLDMTWVSLPTNNATFSRTMTADDNGTIYTCMASHPAYPSLRNCSLGPVIVHYAPEVVLTLTYSYQVQSSNNSDFITLTCMCQVSANPPVTKYSWSIENLKSISVRAETDRTSLLFIDVAIDSVIEDATFESVQSVGCQATNSLGVGAAKVEIDFSDFLNDTSPGILPAPARVTSRSLKYVGPIVGAFIAGVCLAFLVFAVVSCLRNKTKSTQRPHRYDISDSKPEPVVTQPYSIGYADGILRQANGSEANHVHSVYEDVQDQARPVPDNNGQYTALVQQGQRDDVYQQLQKDGTNDYTDVKN